MEIIDNIPVWGAPVDDGALKQIKTCYYIFGQAAVMADHHKGYGVPIGGVIAHETLVSPSGVGYDIGCGNKAVLTDADAADVRAKIAPIMDDIWNTISFGLARKNKERVENARASLSLYSTIHGAGRVMGRMEAKGKRDRSSGEWKREPKVTQEMMDAWVNEAKVELRGGGLDESPHRYKRLTEVLTEHADSVRILHTLKPLGVAMAFGARENLP